MPIYAYRCTSCGHAKDVLQKVSDPLLTDCPACGAATFTKQVTAAGFQLKGSGWYVTDFRGGNSGAGKAEADEAGGGEKPADTAPEKPSEKTTDDKAAAKPVKAAEGSGDKAASPAPAPAPAVTPAAPAAGPKSSSPPPPAPSVPG